MLTVWDEPSLCLKVEECSTKEEEEGGVVGWGGEERKKERMEGGREKRGMEGGESPHSRTGCVNTGEGGRHLNQPPSPALEQSEPWGISEQGFLKGIW